MERDRQRIYFPFRSDTKFSPTNIIKNAQHSDLRGELLPPAHKPNMLQPGHCSGSSRAFTVCKCTSTVGRRGGPANQIAGRDKREDSDQYSEKDVFVVQSGSSKINDSIMELLILISACKGGSANKITGMAIIT